MNAYEAAAKRWLDVTAGIDTRPTNLDRLADAIAAYASAHNIVSGDTETLARRLLNV